VRAKPVAYDGLGAAVFLQDALRKLRCGGLVPLRGDHGLQSFAFVIDGPPEMAELVIDLDLIQVPAPLRIAAAERSSYHASPR